MAASLVSEIDKEIPLPTSPSQQSTVRKSLKSLAGANTVQEDHGRSSKGFTSEEDDDEMPVRSTRRTRPVRITLSSDDSPQPQTPTKTSRLSRIERQGRSSLVKSDSEAPTANLQQKLSDSPDPTSPSNGGTKTGLRSAEKMRANKAKAVVLSDGSENSSSEDVVATPVQRRMTTARVRPPSQDSSHKEEEESSDDLQEELEDLQDTVTSSRNTRTRDVPIMSERSKRQQKLEELRRRRAGVREVSEGEDEQYEDEGEEEEADLSEPEPIHHAMRRGSNLDEYEEEFVDDEDDKVGVDLGVAGVPLEFTYHANKKPFEHFKTEIEWMVNNKLNPAFDRYDEMYQLAHRKLDKEVEGFAGSKFSSSVWGEDFMKALQERPDLARIDVPTMLEHKCDACRRGNHPPKHKVTFTGKPYNRDTLEPIEYDDEEDDTEDSDNDDRSSSSSTQEGKTFFLGRFDYFPPINPFPDPN